MVAREEGRLCVARTAERGFAAISLLTLLVIASLYTLTNRLHVASNRAPHAREAQSVETLNRAKSALIAFAAENVNRPGGLPCPDRNGDGEAELSCDRPEQRLGLFPWQTLKTGDLRDASGARFWYAVSKGFRNDPDVTINSHTQGDLVTVQLRPDRTRSTLANDVVALVIAPGAALPGQDRSGTSATRAEAWLESHNLGGDLRAFNIDQKNDRYNDTITALSHGELFDVVDRIVASRMRTEIAPLLREQVLEPWRVVPFAVPFEAPTASAFKDETRSNLHEGLLPATDDRDWVRWDLRTIEAETSGSGTVGRITCAASTPREVRCDVEYSGVVNVRIAATALDVGRALVRPLRAEDADFGPSLLMSRRISNGAVDRTGNARIEAAATLPATSHRVRLYLRAPEPIAVLTDQNVPVATPHSWFARNRWHELLYYAAAAHALPGGTPSRCDGSGSPCITIEDRRGETTRVAALLVFMGRPRADLAASNANALSAYLEGDNAIAGDRSFADGTPSAGFNDALIVLCTTVVGGCK